MSAFASGDTLTPSTLNARLSSAVSVGGYSVNSLRPESGLTLILAAERVQIGAGPQVPGANGLLSIASGNAIAKDAVVIISTHSGGIGPLGIYCAPTFYGASDTNGIGSGTFGSSGLNPQGGTVYQWQSVCAFEPGVSGAGSVGTSMGFFASDFTNGAKSFAIFTGRGAVRLGDTSRFTDGSAGAPSLAMDSEVSLGFYRSAASHLALSYGTFQSSVSGANIYVGSILSVNGSGAGFVVASSGVTIMTGAAANASLFGTSFQTGKGAGMLHVGNCSVSPSVNPTGGGLLFARGGALLWLGGSGSLTTIAAP